MKLSIIIVNYNTVNLLRDCINNLIGIFDDYEVIVVDNGSSDGSADMVQSEFIDPFDDERTQNTKENLVSAFTLKDFIPNIILIKTNNNGIAAANNLALKKASGDYFMHVGTDAYPKKYVVKELISYMERNPDVGVTTARLVTRDDKPDMDAHRGFPTPWAAITHFSKLNRIFPKSKLFNQYFIGWQDLYSTHEIDLLISHFCIVKKAVYSDVTSWDDDFFVYGEDVDFCYRVKQAGWKIMYLGHLEVLHFKGAGVGRKTSQGINNASSSSIETRVAMKKASVNSMKLFYKKHYSKKYSALITIPVLAAVAVLGYLRVKRVK